MDDQFHNFFDHWCKEIGQNIFLRACRNRIAEIHAGTDAGRYGACVAAIAAQRCPAVQMTEKELLKGEVIFYKDRDDCGPGVVKRAEIGLEPRSAAMIAAHHELLKSIDQAPWTSPINLNDVQSRNSVVRKRSYVGSVPHDRVTETIPLGLADVIEAKVKALV